MTETRPIALVAMGGHAFMQKGESGTIQDHERNADRITELLMTLIERGYNLIITHGNGPQVGNLLLQHEQARDVVPAMPLDVLVAMTEGSLGYILQQSMLNQLRRRDIPKLRRHRRHAGHRRRERPRVQGLQQTDRSVPGEGRGRTSSRRVGLADPRGRRRARVAPPGALAQAAEGDPASHDSRHGQRRSHRHRLRRRRGTDHGQGRRKLRRCRGRGGQGPDLERAGLRRRRRAA